MEAAKPGAHGKARGAAPAPSPLPAEAAAPLSDAADTLPASLADEAVDLLRETIRVDTSNPPGREMPLAELFASYLRDAGLEPEIVEPEPGRASVVARLDGEGPLRPLLLSAHLDVVPADASEWRYPPFAAEIHDGYVWGRGTVDMKAMAAMSAVVVKALARAGGKRRRDVIFAGVADEEAGGGRGAAFLCQERPDLVAAEYGLTEVGGFTLPYGDVTLVPVQVAEKGVERVTLRARGRAGHGSIPHEDNALVKLGQAISRFDRPLAFRATREARGFLSALGEAQGFPASVITRLLALPGLGPLLLPLLPEERRRPIRAILHDLATPTQAAAGIGPNVIPGEATAYLDARYLPGTKREELLEMIARRAGPDVSVEGQGGMGPISMPHPTPLFDAIASVMARAVPGARVVPYLMPGFTDAKHYAALGMTVYGFAPVALARDEPFASLYHAADERISIAGFKRGLEWLYDVVAEMLS